MIAAGKQSKLSKLRARIAPSPSGLLHLGNLFVAAFNMLFCMKHNASLILRLEDTDSAKANVYCSLAIGKMLSQFGILADEAPESPGFFGPYAQSGRGHIYKFYADVLVAANKAFYCSCSFRRISALKKVNLALGDAAVYDGRCIKSNLMVGKLRLKIPKAGSFNSSECRVRWINSEMQIL